MRCLVVLTWVAMRHRLFLPIFPSPVGSAVRIATTNWQSANVLSHIIQMKLEESGIKVEEKYYESYAEMLHAMRKNELDVIPEIGPCTKQSDCSSYFSDVGANHADAFCNTSGECRLCHDCDSCSDGIDGTCSTCRPCNPPTETHDMDMDVSSHAWNYFLSEGIYMPEYMEDKMHKGNNDGQDAFDWSLDGARAREDQVGYRLQYFYGVLVPQWNAAHSVNQLEAHLNLPGVERSTRTRTGTDHQQKVTANIVEKMKWEKRIAFYGWSPDFLTAEYKVRRVSLPLKKNTKTSNVNINVDASYFPPPSPRRMIWRTSNLVQNDDMSHPAAVSVLTQIGFTVTEKKLTDAMATFLEYERADMDPRSDAFRVVMRFVLTHRVCFSSPTATDSNSSSVVASSTNCVGGADNGGGPDLWRHEKQKLDVHAKLPLEPPIVVEMRQCSGFVECGWEIVTTQAGTMERREKRFVPIGGYSYEHIQKVLRMIGYDPNSDDVIYSCATGTFDDTIENVKKELVDIGHHCATMTDERQALLDFTAPFYFSSLSLAALRKDDAATEISSLADFQNSLILFKGLDMKTILLILVVLVFSALMIGCLEFAKAFPDEEKQGSSEKGKSRGIPEKKQDGKRIRANVQYVQFYHGYKTAIECYEGEHTELVEVLRSRCSRVCAMAMYAMSIFAAALFVANLTAEKTVVKLAHPIRDVSDLAERRLSAVTECNSSMDAWLRRNYPGIDILCQSHIGPMVEVLRGEDCASVSKHACEQEPRRCVWKNKSCGPPGFLIADTPIIENYMKYHCSEIDLIGNVFFEQDYGVMVPKTSPLLKPLSTAITYLGENDNEFHKLAKDKYFENNCKEPEGYANEYQGSITMLDITSILIVLLLVLWTLHYLVPLLVKPLFLLTCRLVSKSRRDKLSV